ASTITRAILETCAIFRCAPVERTGSHRLKRFVLRAARLIPSTFDDGLTIQQREEADFALEAGEVYAIDVVVAAGEGKVGLVGSGWNDRDEWIEWEQRLRSFIPHPHAMIQHSHTSHSIPSTPCADQGVPIPVHHFPTRCPPELSA
ncbi:hypothetical protein BC938DRAFT_475744, partial [Jimgerdemannia flammicorona]